GDAWGIKALARIGWLDRANRRELLRIIFVSLGSILRIVDLSHQSRMRDRNVISLEIVVDVNLPVALNDIVAPFGELQPVETKSERFLRNISKKRRERLGARVEIHEDKIFPGIDPQRHHAHRAAIEKLHTLDIWRPDQPAVQGISPPVIPAAQH